MKKKHPMLFNVNVVLCMVPCTLAMINVTLTGTTTRHVCKDQDIDFKWTYDDTDPDKDFIKTIQWSKDPSGYLIMKYETDPPDLDITSSPNDYTGRVKRTTGPEPNDIGMRLKQAGSTDVDDEGKYYVSLIVDKPGGDADDYFVPYRDPQGVQVYVCVGVDDTYPLPSLSLTYDETTHVLNCSGPTTLGNTTFAIFDPSMTTIVTSTTDIILTTGITADRAGGTYRCKTYCTRQGSGDTPQGTCLPTDATLVLPAWSSWDAWTNCTTPGNSRTRTRDCDNPPPSVNGPQSCPGADSETEICPTPPPAPVPDVTLTGTTTRHVCKGEDIDFKWTYDDTDPDKDFIKTIQWSKDPSGYLIMEYETAYLDITSSPNNYTGRVERTTGAGSNDIGMRLKQAGATDVDDDGKYYVSLIVDKPDGDANDYVVPYRDPQGVQVYVCVGVDDTFHMPSLNLTYDENTHVITCSGPSSLGDTTFSIFDPSMNTVVNSTTDTVISKDISSHRIGGTYRCKAYCTQQGDNETPQGACLPTDTTIVLPAWSSWNTWTNCTTPGATIIRTRTCDNPPPTVYGPQSCPGVNSETEICPTPPPTPPHPVNGTWGDWTAWTPCSVTCDNGTETRTRECDDPAPENGGDNCTGDYDEIMECFERYCPVNGGWGNWKIWTACSVTCENGTQTRTRECDNPEPENGGDNCTGDYDEIMECFERYCPVNGSWGDWTAWTPCSVTCENGTQTRTRECDDPAPEYGGENCTGDYDEVMECFDRYCPVNGAWGNWKIWTSCSVTCDNGTQTRTRECDDPAPEYGGENCTGDYEEIMECFERYCPVNGAWGNWKNWIPCSVTCDNGTQTRNRECDDPAPEYGGDDCTGPYVEIIECFEEQCSTNRSSGDWTVWTQCSVTCGNGTQIRNRECETTEPSNGGNNCTRPVAEIMECFEGYCPVNGSWGNWTVWTPCSVTCGNGTQTRNRECDSPAPEYGGDNCSGSYDEISECFGEYCIATTVHQPEADSVWPTFGPQSGGTDITIRGQSLLIHGQVIVYVGPKECTTVYLNETVTIVRTLGLQADEANLLDRKLAVYIAIDNSTNLTSIAEFTYRTDPVVDSVYPKESIVPGGTSINARGSNFYSVAVIKMETTMLLKKWIVQEPPDQNETRTLYITDCEVQNDTQMICLTASITLPDVFMKQIVKTKQKRHVDKPTLAAPDIGPLHSRSKRQGNPQWVTPDGDYTLEFYIGFRLDGVHDYKNFTPIAIYVEPVFVESGSRKKFEKGERISFKGEHLDRGVTVYDYAITVGLEICTDVELVSNSLSCLPPQTEPSNTTANEEEIIVHIGLNLDHFAGHLIYPNGQLPFYVWVIVGVLPALLITVIIVIIVLRQNTVQ